MNFAVAVDMELRAIGPIDFQSAAEAVAFATAIKQSRMQTGNSVRFRLTVMGPDQTILHDGDIELDLVSYKASASGLTD